MSYSTKVSISEIEENIASCWYFTAADGVCGAAASGVSYADQPPLATNSPLNCLTFCVLILRNGFTVTGQSACVDHNNFDADIGKKIARNNAIDNVWPLMGYALKQKINESK